MMANETMDFLTALASRNGLAGGDLPLVQPRTPSRFEPVAPDAGAWLVETSSDVEAAREERRAPQARDASQPITPASASAQTLAPSNTPTPHIETRSINPALRVIERLVHERETHTIRVIEREQLVQTPPVPAMMPLDAEAHVTSPTPAPVQAAISAMKTSAQPQPVLQPKPPASTKPSTTPAAPQPEPTTQPPDIHITIGRIDVRANVAVKKSEPARSRANAPNLQRYLNSLSGTPNSGDE
jgi:hypothetical protein